MANVVVNYEIIIELIRKEVELLRRENEKYSNLKIIVEDERLLAKSKDRSPETMYIQIKFGAASTNFGQAVLPFSMEVIGINQDIQLTQDFLNEFVNNYNRTVSGDITQFFLTPVVSQNNLPIYEGYRSLFIVSATFVISNGLASLQTLKYKISDNKYEDNEFLAFNFVGEASLNPQPYSSNIDSKTTSYGSFQTFAFTLVTYPDANKQLIIDIYSWLLDKERSHINDNFIFSGVFKNISKQFEDWRFKCRSVNGDQKIGEQPLLTITFTL